MTDRERSEHWQRTALLLADQVVRMAKVVRMTASRTVLQDSGLNQVLAETETLGTGLRNSPYFTDNTATIAEEITE